MTQEQFEEKEEIIKEEKKKYTMYKGDEYYKLAIYSKACEKCGTVVKTNNAYVIVWDLSKDNYCSCFVCKGCSISAEKEIENSINVGRIKKVDMEFLKYCQIQSKKVISREKTDDLKKLIIGIQDIVVSFSDEIIVEIKQFNESLLSTIIRLAEKEPSFYQEIKDEIINNNKNLLDYMGKLTNNFDNIIQNTTLMLKLIQS